MGTFDVEQARREIATAFRTSILPALSDYVEIPAKSPHFDPDWAAHGHLERAVARAEQWCREQPLHGLRSEVVRLPGRTPLLLLEIPGSGNDTVPRFGMRRLRAAVEYHVTAQDRRRGLARPGARGSGAFG